MNISNLVLTITRSHGRPTVRYVAIFNAHFIENLLLSLNVSVTQF